MVFEYSKKERKLRIAHRVNDQFSLVKYPSPRKADSYPHLTNGDEKQSERLPGTFATRASLSRWFASQIATQACHFRPRSEPMVIVAGACPERRATTANISGSISAFAERSGWERVYPRICTKRKASGDNRPNKRISPSTRGPCRASMRQPLVRQSCG